MKKFLFLLVLISGLTARSAFAAAEVPKSSIWFEPATAKAGETIQLNALVYNNQTADATVTVAFTDPAGTIGTASATIPKGIAKTLTVNWKMPSATTTVTAAVSAAVTSSKQSLPGLVGTIGTVSVGATTPESTVFGLSFPGSKQIAAWFGPVISKIETWRIAQNKYFVSLQTDTQKKLGIKNRDSINIQTLPAKIVANPGGYIVLLYAGAGVSIFSSQALFYIVSILLFLILLRFIVNRFV